MRGCSIFNQITQTGQAAGQKMLQMGSTAAHEGGKKYPNNNGNEKRRQEGQPRLEQKQIDSCQDVVDSSLLANYTRTFFFLDEDRAGNPAKSLQICCKLTLFSLTSLSPVCFVSQQKGKNLF